MPKPSWDAYFLNFAEVAATRSPDPKTKVGAVLVRNNHILATGYNGLIAGKNENIDWTNRDYIYKRIIHAEMNCLLHAETSAMYGSILYVTHSPCCECIKLIAASQIKDVFFKEEYRDYEFVSYLAKELGVYLRKI